MMDYELCVSRGWGVGTRLRGTESDGKGWEHTAEIEITYLSPNILVAKWGTGEWSTTLSCRTWEEVK